MHRPNFGLATSIIALAMQNFGKSLQTFDRELHDAAPALADLAAVIRPRRSRGPGGKQPWWKRSVPSPAYQARQRYKQRWLRGERVPKDMQAVFEQAKADRAPLLARRAYAARRSAEGKVLQAARNGSDRALQRTLEACWAAQMPFPSNVMVA